MHLCHAVFAHGRQKQMINPVIVDGLFRKNPNYRINPEIRGIPTFTEYRVAGELRKYTPYSVVLDDLMTQGRI